MKNLLIYRLVVVNTAWIALMVWFYIQGYVEYVLNGDHSRISYVIVLLHLIGLVSTFLWGYKISQNMNDFKDGTITIMGKTKSIKYPAKIAHLKDISEWLVTLGLIGNVVGFVLALKGIDVSALGTAEGAQKAAGNLLSGMSVAFFSTLTGAVTALWTSINYRIIETASKIHVKDSK
jgi:hypothetical protein